ncbi:MAG: PD-(D/E)XK nuclease-like domain-containing protein [Candidatus Nanopelagicaceae bacterium]
MSSSRAEVSYFQADGDYRRQTGESQSHLKSILLSPAHYKANQKRRFKPSSVMTIGTATHCKALEGDKTFESNFILKPDNIKYTTKEGRDWRDSQRNKTILVNDGIDRQWDSVIGMTDSLRQMEWFDPSQKDYRKYNEVSFYWQENGIDCKARLDRIIVTDEEVHVLDLKTTDSISVEKFQSKAVDLGYDFQAGWYSHAAELVYEKPVRFTFVAIERNEPWSIGIFEVPPEMIAEARRKNRKALNILKKCLDTNEWPGIDPEPKMLEYPRWYTPMSDTTEPLGLSNNQNDFVPLF